MSANWTGEVVSVTELIDRARVALDDGVGRIAIEAEVFDYRGPHSSGHYYFKLRDSDSSLDVRMWRGVAARGLQCDLKEGRSVLAIGRLDIWSKRGSLSFLLEQVRDIGVGNLAQRFEELKNRLRAEGLFDPERRVPVPARPQKVALITAQPSAAAADILRTLEELQAPFELLLLPSRVQGEGAAAELVSVLTQAIAAKPDVILFARGGGSLEDLWAFNEEVLVRAISDCPIPVICAVGHEVDFCLCDFVADERAKTPTAGAARLCEGWREARIHLTDLARRFLLSAEQHVQEAQLDLKGWRLQLQAQSPESRLERFRRRIHENEMRIAFSMETSLGRSRHALTSLARLMESCGPKPRMKLHKQNLEAWSARLEAGSPTALLQRGYALVELEGQPGFLRDVKDVEVGQTLHIALAQGTLQADVTEKAIDTGESLPSAEENLRQ